MDALTVNLWICAALAAACWIASVVTREYSWTDRVWSVVPVAYAWVFAAHAHDARSTLVAMLITFWGVRLTFNFARRGGYAPGGEDYRWAVLRERLPRWAYAALNVVFIAGFQNALLLAIVLPMVPMAEHPAPLGWADAVVGLVFVGLLVLETVADQQRWAFHRAGAPGGVLRSGLYRWSRHPNYFGELGQWWAVFAFALVAAGTAGHIYGTGVVALTALFVGSTRFTEQITASRHPAFVEYRRVTSMIIPWPPRRVRIPR